MSLSLLLSKTLYERQHHTSTLNHFKEVGLSDLTAGILVGALKCRSELNELHHTLYDSRKRQGNSPERRPARQVKRGTNCSAGGEGVLLLLSERIKVLPRLSPGEESAQEAVEITFVVQPRASLPRGLPHRAQSVQLRVVDGHAGEATVIGDVSEGSCCQCCGLSLKLINARKLFTRPNVLDLSCKRVLRQLAGRGAGFEREQEQTSCSTCALILAPSSL